jgi:hypothetical protein
MFIPFGPVWRQVRERRRRYQEECQKALAEGREFPPYPGMPFFSQLLVVFLFLVGLGLFLSVTALLLR